MTRSELIRRLVEVNQGLSLAQADKCVSIILDEISETLSEGGRVELRGFGVFEVRKRKARVGRNPRTGESVKVPSKAVPFFKAGKDLKEQINKPGTPKFRTR